MGQGRARQVSLNYKSAEACFSKSEMQQRAVSGWLVQARAPGGHVPHVKTAPPAVLLVAATSLHTTSLKQGELLPVCHGDCLEGGNGWTGFRQWQARAGCAVPSYVRSAKAEPSRVGLSALRSPRAVLKDASAPPSLTSTGKLRNEYPAARVGCARYGCCTRRCPRSQCCRCPRSRPDTRRTCWCRGWSWSRR